MQDGTMQIFTGRGSCTCEGLEQPCACYVVGITLWLEQGERGLEWWEMKSERWMGKMTEGLLRFHSQCDGESKESVKQGDGMALLV